MVRGAGFRVQGARFRVQGSGFRVQGSELRVDLEAVHEHLAERGGVLVTR